MPSAPQPSCYSRLIPDKGYQTCFAMTRRDFGMLCIFTTPTALRENAQPYRFWGLKIFSSLTLRFQDFQRKLLENTGTIAYGDNSTPV